jgi:hypothetical protein
MKHGDEKKHLARIVVEFSGDYAMDNAKSKIDDIRQAVMCRNPLDEPFVRAETSEDNGETWQDMAV